MASVVRVAGVVQDATPLPPASVPVTVNATSVRYQPLTGAVVACTLATGAVLSICTFTTLLVAELPARSVTLALTGVVPSALTTTGAGHPPTRPDPFSLQVKLTVTSPLNHPL